MSSKTIVITLAISLASSMLAGCASDDSATTYSQGQMRQMQTVQLGTVISVQQVKPKGEDNGLLTLGGAALGGIAGSTMGGGNRGSAVGTIVGALAGGFGAQAAQTKLSTKAALEITVQLDGSGRMISIVQDANVQLVTGQRVRVLSGGGNDRVVPY